MSTLTLHHLEYSQSFRILWLLEELGVDYSLKLYDRDPQSRLAPADYKAMSPTGTAPFITDGELTLAETSAIVDYILDKHDAQQRLRPPAGHPSRLRYLFWLHASQGSMMPLLLMDSVMRMGKQHELLQTLQGVFLGPRMDALLQQAEQDLARTAWLAGDDLTAADIVMVYGMEGARARGYITEEHTGCCAWLDRVHALPSFQSAQKKDDRPSIVFA